MGANFVPSMPSDVGLGRRDFTVTTDEIDMDERLTFAIDLGESWRLLTFSIDIVARVVIYTTQAAMNTDANREVGTDPTDGSGVLFEYVSTGNVTDTPLVPVPHGYKTSGSNYMAVTNLSGVADTATIEFAFVREE